LARNFGSATDCFAVSCAADPTLSATVPHNVGRWLLAAAIGAGRGFATGAPCYPKGPELNQAAKSCFSLTFLANSGDLRVKCGL
jgi:hypothetical protein